MPEHQSLIPHIKRVAVTNLLLFLFFMSPSFLSFFALVIAIFVIIFDNPYETFSALLNTPQDHHMSQNINELFKKYNSLGLLEQILIVVGIKLFIDFTWILPTWLIVFFLVEIYAAWGILQQFGILDQGKKVVGQANEGIQKVIAMIPRHQS